MKIFTINNDQIELQLYKNPLGKVVLSIYHEGDNKDKQLYVFDDTSDLEDLGFEINRLYKEVSDES